MKAVVDGSSGLKITLIDPLSALRIILEQTGVLKRNDDGIDVLAEAIRADKERYAGRHGR